MKLDTILQGDALDELKALPADSVDCVMTSPPYWGLRDYGHEGQLGMEPDFETFVENLCLIFDEVMRVLKPTGTCWVNIGDSFGGNVGGAQGKNGQFAGRKVTAGRIKSRRPNPKCMLQIPARFAIAMTDRGWILRNEIIWHKPNAMPQSVKDRFTVDYEKLFFFTKSLRYYFDQQYEPWVQRPNDIARAAAGHKGYSGKHAGGDKAQGIKGQPVGDPERGRNMRSVWSISTRAYPGAHFAVYPPRLVETPIKAGCPEGGVVLDPFFGSGTTGVVAQQLNRRWIGIELNPEYVEIANKRMSQGGLGI